MSTLSALPNPERHAENVARAMRTERANHPRQLVVLAVFVLFGCLLAMVVSWGSYRGAIDRLERQRLTAANVVRAAGRFKALQAAEAANSAGPRVADSSANILGRIEAAGVEARLRDPVRSPLRSNTYRQPNSNAARMVLEYDVRDPSLSAIMDWIERVTTDIPGLETYAISVRPEPQHWVVRVTFSRWQRAEGT